MNKIIWYFFRINQSDKSEKSSREENLSRSIHNDNKEKVYNEERVRLQNENLKKQLELESIEQILITNINEKTEEIQNLTHELNKQSNVTNIFGNISESFKLR